MGLPAEFTDCKIDRMQSALITTPHHGDSGFLSTLEIKAACESRSSIPRYSGAFAVGKRRLRFALPRPQNTENEHAASAGAVDDAPRGVAYLLNNREGRSPTNRMRQLSDPLAMPKLRLVRGAARREPAAKQPQGLHHAARPEHEHALARGLRTPVNNIEYFPPNCEGLVLGCIDADFCK